MLATEVVTAGPAAEEAVGASARAARRWFLVLAPPLAGISAIVGAAADPYTGDGAAMFQAYADHPGAVQVKSLGYHFAFLLIGAAALALVAHVRSRGAWMANAAGVLALLGVATMPGFVLSDFFNSAIGQLFTVEGTVRVDALIDRMWALSVMAATGGPALLVTLPLAVAAACRGGLLPWWSVLPPVLGLVGFSVVGANVGGAVVLTVFFAVLSVPLARSPALAGSAPRREW